MKYVGFCDSTTTYCDVVYTRYFYINVEIPPKWYFVPGPLVVHRKQAIRCKKSAVFWGAHSTPCGRYGGRFH